MTGSITTTCNGRKFQINKWRKRMDVSELTAGMYIVELDRPWTESPFLFQGFLLENDNDLLLIQTLCKWVFVDVVEEEWNERDKKGKSIAQKRTRYVEKQEVAQQLSAANRTCQAAKLQIKRLLASAQLG